MRNLLIIIFLVLFGTIAEAQTVRQSFNRGTQAAKNGNYVQALENYQKSLVKIDAGNSAAFLTKIHYNIGVCLFQLKRNAEAVIALEKAVTASGGNYEKAFYALGAAHKELNNRAAAKKAFGAAITLGSREAWFDLGLILIEENDYQSAAAAFRAAINNNSVAIAASHNNLGVILAIDRNFAAAEKEFETALRESNGEFIEAKNNLEFCRRHTADSLQANLIFSR